jgi:predicted O-methyltransferase YrrM
MSDRPTTPAGRIRRRGLAALQRRILAPRGLHLARLQDERVVPRTYYSPIPEWEALPDEHWTRRDPMPGVDWDVAPALELLRTALPELLAEYRDPAIPGAGPDERRSLLGFYDGLDAAGLHAMLRLTAPRTVVELGSGVSTLIMIDALRANAAKGRGGRLRSFDPYPRRPTEGGLAAFADAELHPVAAEDVDAQVFAELGAGDVLFVDTTHAVRAGGDVHRILLDVLPRLAPGVLVHVHDILLPYEYHRGWFQDGLYWTEQYVLQAVLQDNPHWEVVMPHHQLLREHPEAVAAAVPAHREGMQPSALWLRRRIPGEPDAPLADRLRGHRPA